MLESHEVDELLNVVGLIYGSAVDPAHTMEALQAINRYVRGSTAQIISFDRGTGEVYESHIDGAVVSAKTNDDYVRHWSAMDPRPKALAALPSGSTLRCHELFDDKYVARSPYYQEFFIPAGFRWAMGGMIHMADGTSTLLADLRAPDAPPFSHREEQFIRRVLPHMERAAHLRSSVAKKLNANGGDLDALVRSFPQPCMVVDRHGRIRSVSGASVPLLRTLRISIFHGQLRCDESRSRSEWNRVFRHVVNSGLAASFYIEAIDQTAWRVHIIPWRSIGTPKDSLEEGLHIVNFEQVAAAVEARVAKLAAAHGLTAAEVGVLVLLKKGRSAKQVAAERRSSLHTVRAQIASVLEKTGCHSQLQLLAKLG
jgi:DNA-binding CsgD family transcriptional regulator